MPIEIGLDLIDLQRRFEAGEAPADTRYEGMQFWAWINGAARLMARTYLAFGDRPFEPVGK